MDQLNSIETVDLTPNPQQKNGKSKLFLLSISVIILTTFLIFLYFTHSNSLRDIALSFFNVSNPLLEIPKVKSNALDKELKQTQKRIETLEKRLNNLTPKEPFLIVNTTHNNFLLKTRNKTIKQSICSTGSYTLLDAGDDRKWIFKTPKGMFHINGKVADPVWIKPDWAFIEEGLPIPKKGSPDRYEYGTLGDYALSLGQGYLIHGTLYQRFLGLPVTHGCIRLGDDDLKAVYRNLDVGSKVFIY